MFGTRMTRSLAHAALVLSLGAGLAACDNPVDEEHEEHPVGIIVLNAQGAEIARINIERNPATTGQITVGRTGAQTFRLVGLGEDGDQITLGGGELTVTASSASTTTATVAIQGADQLVVTGRAAGSTTLTLDLNHDGHQELTGTIPLIVQ